MWSYSAASSGTSRREGFSPCKWIWHVSCFLFPIVPAVYCKVQKAAVEIGCFSALLVCNCTYIFFLLCFSKEIYILYRDGTALAVHVSLHFNLLLVADAYPARMKWPEPIHATFSSMRLIWDQHAVAAAIGAIQASVVKQMGLYSVPWNCFSFMRKMQCIFGQGRQQNRDHKRTGSVYAWGLCSLYCCCWSRCGLVHQARSSRWCRAEMARWTVFLGPA